MSNLVGTIVYPDGTAFNGTLTLRLNGPAKDGSNNLVIPAYQNFTIGTTGVVDITIGDTETLTSIDSSSVFYDALVDDDGTPTNVGELKFGTGTVALADAWINAQDTPHASITAYVPFNNTAKKWPSRAGNDTGTFTSAMSYRTGKLSQSLPVNGHGSGSFGDVVAYPPGSNFNGNRYARINANQGALSVWVKPHWNGNDTTTRVLLDTANPSPIRIVKGTGTTLTMTVGGQNATAQVGAWSAGTWYHLAARWDKNNVVTGSNYFELYVDNVLKGQSTSAPTGTTSGNIFIGCGTSGGSQAGVDFDDLAIWSRPITTTEIGNIYNSGNAAEAGIIADVALLTYVKFDGSGNLTSGTNTAMGCSWPWAANHATNGDFESGTAGWQMSYGTLGLTTSGTNLLYDGTTIEVKGTSVSDLGFIWQQPAFGSGINYFIAGQCKNGHTQDALRIDIGSNTNGNKYSISATSFELVEVSMQSTGSQNPFIYSFVAANGTGYRDNIWVGTHLLNNGGFEGNWTGGTIPEGWTRVGGCVGTNIVSGMHSGTGHLRVQAGDSSGTHYQNAVTVTNAKWHAFVGYLLTGAGTCNIDLSGAATTTLSGTQTAWTRKAHVFKATGTTLNVRCYANSGGTANFDDFAVIQLDDVDVTATPAAVGSSYDTGKWGTALGALRVDGGDTLTLPGTTANGRNIWWGTGAISLWVYPEGWHGGDGVIHTFLDINVETNKNRIHVQKNDSNLLYLRIYGSVAGGYKSIDYAIGSSTFGSNVWHNIQAGWTAAGPDYLMLDGTAVGTSSTGGSWANVGTTGANISIGSDTNGNYQFDGLIDEVRIYDAIPTAAQKTAIYNDEEYLGYS